jgi:hypothetical protein
MHEIIIFSFYNFLIFLSVRFDSYFFNKFNKFKKLNINKLFFNLFLIT